MALNWFKSYLSDRKQCVKYRGVESEFLTRYGTAQGSACTRSFIVSGIRE